MKRLIVFGLVAGLVFSTMAAPADAGKKKKKKEKRVERTVKAEYSGPGFGVATPAGSGGACSPALAMGCVTFATGSDDLFMQLKMKDTVPVGVAAAIGQDSNPDDVGVEIVAEVCTKTKEPVPIQPGLEIVVFFFEGTCQDGSPSIVTTGTAVGTFSNLP